MSHFRSSLLVLAATLAGLLGCQKAEEHPPFAAACEKNCPLLPGISIGAGSGSAGGSAIPGLDGGTGTMQGNVLLVRDDSFVPAGLYPRGATVTADGASGSPVSDHWNGADPFSLERVARATPNWVSIEPDVVSDDALPTYQAVQTDQATNVDLKLVAASTLDLVFNAVSTLRSPDAGQVVLFFRSAGTGAPLSGLHVVMTKAQVAMYASPNGWILDDATAITDASGLVVFGNVDPANSSGTQLVTVTRAATAAGQFATKVVQGAVTIATVDVQL